MPRKSLPAIKMGVTPEGLIKQAVIYASSQNWETEEASIHYKTRLIDKSGKIISQDEDFSVLKIANRIVNDGVDKKGKPKTKNTKEFDNFEHDAFGDLSDKCEKALKEYFKAKEKQK